MVDMGSTDGSVALAKELGAKVLTHELVPYPNLARQHGIAHAQHEWVVTIDLDEVFPKHELDKITAVIESRSDLAGIRIPWQFYFRDKVLTCTSFGQPKTKCIIVHRDRIQATPYVHKEFLSDGPTIHIFRHGEIAPLQHYWITSYAEFFDKMGRYLKDEGATKYNVKGQRFSWLRTLKYTAVAIKENFINYRGLWGGIHGIFLSTYLSWYVFISWLSLRRYERNLRARGQDLISIS